MRRMLWRAKRTAIRSGKEWQLPAFEVEFETNADFKLDGEVPDQLEFLRGKDLRYYTDVCKRNRVEVTFVKFVDAP